MKTLDEYGLTGFPFRLTPDKEYAKIWVGNEEVKKKFEHFFNVMGPDSPTQILLLYGYFGTGKSHALMHFSQKLLEKKIACLIYTDLTGSSPDSFFGLSKQFMRALDPTLLSDAVRELGIDNTSSESMRKLRKVTENIDIETLRAIASAVDESKLDEVMLWLQGETCDKQLLGVKRKISDDSKALGVASSVIRVLQTQYRFVGWLLDEYGTLYDIMANRRSGVFDRIRKGLINLYNSCSTGFLLAFSFTGKQSDIGTEMIPESLMERIASMERSSISFPMMSVDSAVEFVRGVLAHFQIPDFKGTFYPFTEDSVRYLIRKGVIDKKKDLVPRWISAAHIDALQAAQNNDISPPLTVEKLKIL